MYTCHNICKHTKSFYYSLGLKLNNNLFGYLVWHKNIIMENDIYIQVIEKFINISTQNNKYTQKKKIIKYKKRIDY